MDMIEFGDCRETMRRWKEQGIKAQTCVTSPPYFGLRDYGHDGQIGLEKTPDEYIASMVEVFRCVRDILTDNGTLWLNIGDSYAGSGKGRNADGTHQKGGKQGTNAGTILGKLVKTEAPDCKPKDLIGIPWMLAFALRADGWYLRQDIIWHKPNPMPESVRDRCTKAHEYIFLLSKSQKYYYDHKSVKDPITAANKRSVWTVNVRPYSGAHFAVFPQELIRPCIMAGAPIDSIVLDPFMGSGTTAQVAKQLGRQYLGCELNPEYKPLQDKRLCQLQLALV